MTRTGVFSIPGTRENMGRSLLLVAVCAALALVPAAPALVQSPGPTQPCQARLDELPPDTTCGEDGGYVFEEPGGGYFAPLETPVTTSASASALPETGGPTVVLAAAALVLASSGVLLALRVARRG